MVNADTLPLTKEVICHQSKHYNLLNLSHNINSQHKWSLEMLRSIHNVRQKADVLRLPVRVNFVLLLLWIGALLFIPLIQHGGISGNMGDNQSSCYLRPRQFCHLTGKNTTQIKCKIWWVLHWILCFPPLHLLLCLYWNSTVNQLLLWNEDTSCFPGTAEGCDY